MHVSHGADDPRVALLNLPPVSAVRPQAYDQHLNMILGDVEEVITTVEIDDETYEEIIKVRPSSAAATWRHPTRRLFPRLSPRPLFQEPRDRRAGGKTNPPRVRVSLGFVPSSPGARFYPA